MRTKKLIAYVLFFALLFGMLPATGVSAAPKISLSTKKLTVTKGKSATLKVKNTKKKVTWKILSGKKNITLKAKGNVAATITGKKKGSAKVQASIGKNKLTCTVTVKNATTNNTTPKPDETQSPVPSESIQPGGTTTPTHTPENPVSEQDKYANAPAPVFASNTMPEDYSTEPVPFKAEIDEFYKQVKEMPVPIEDEQTYNSYINDGFSVRKLEIDGIPLYEVKKEGSEPKPLVILLHPGFQHKNLKEAADLAAAEDVCMVTIDCSGSGESQDGPIQAPAAFMETVKDIDVLIEYYNTVHDVDAANFGLMGRSLGGNISLYYVLYGKYKPTAINVMNASADLTGEGSVWDCFDKGVKGQTPIWTEEQLKSFSTATRALAHPEYFKDIWVYACYGEQDDMHSPVGMKKLCQAVEALGSEKVVYHLYEGVGHETPQNWRDNEQKEFFLKMRSQTGGQ